MASTLLGIDHVALRCFDSKATERFYGELLGLPVVERADGVSQEWEGRAWRLTGFRLPSGALLDFFEVEGTERPASQGTLDTVAHVALAVDTRADLEAWREKLERNGFPILEEQDHGKGRHSLYFADPNGHYTELTCRPKR
jgi:catechol 2,3-dioxygenase-like lactoylglutathione lyase family enzyme